MLDNVKFSFIKHCKIFWIVSACIMCVGLLMNVIFGVEMDVAFKGGTLLKYSYTGELDMAAAETFFTEQIGEKATVETSVDGGVTLINVYSTAVVDNEKQQTINDTFAKSFEANTPELTAANAIQPSLGNLFFVKCLVALLLASLLLVFYVAYRFRKIGGWSAGLMAVVALVHDLLIVYFTFVIFRIPLDGNFVAVMLTILGYSLNDTIVIYDRIRENRSRLGKSADICEVVDLSLRQSFRRTMNTSVTTTIVVLTLVVVALTQNLDAIISFAVPLFFGVLSGFYSSTFLCAPAWALWTKKRNK